MFMYKKFLFLLFSLSLWAGAAQKLETFLIRSSDLEKTKELIQNGDKVYSAAYKSLLKKAQSALKNKLYSVMEKDLAPASGDKHDYMSFGPYWWPDPSKSNGLPYKRKDGVLNPASRDHRSDHSNLNKMLKDVKILTFAFYYSGDEKYSARAVKVLNHWFLNKETKMNPNLNFGQAIPGKTDGRGIGIIETRYLPELLDELLILTLSKHFDSKISSGLNEWMAAYLDWLLTSKNGNDEAKTKNNHGTWYDVQVIALALFTGKKELARKLCEKAMNNRLVAQIKPDGKQPHELSRTRSLDYSLMNLKGFSTMARLAENVDVDLWQKKEPVKLILQAALFLQPHSKTPAKWPYKQIKKADSTDFYFLMNIVGDTYGSQPLRNSANKLKSQVGYELLFQ